MHRYRHPDPMNLIKLKTSIGVLCSLGLGVWGWLKPERHFQFFTQTVVIPVRGLFWVMGIVLLRNTIIYAVREFRAWADMP